MYPLHHAIQINDRIMFDNALDNNADVNQIDMDDQIPLNIAIKSPNDRIWFVNRLVQHPNIEYDYTFVLKAIKNLEMYCRKDILSIQKLIQFFPRSVNMWEDIPKYYNLKFALRIIHANIENSTTIARQQLIDDFLNAEIINLEAESKNKYFSIFDILIHNNANKDFNNILLSLIKAGHSLVDTDQSEKLPIEYAWESDNRELIAMLFDYGSPCITVKSKDDKDKWIKIIPRNYKDVFETIDLEKISHIKSRLMIPSTTHFAKNQQLGKRAISRYLRTPSSSRLRRTNNDQMPVQKQAFDTIMQELATIEID